MSQDLMLLMIKSEQQHDVWSNQMACIDIDWKKYLIGCVVMMATSFSLMSAGCTYDQRFPRATVDLRLEESDVEGFLEVMFNFAVIQKGVVTNYSQKFPSGAETLFYEIANANGTLIRINDLMDGKHIVVAIFDDEGSKWKRVADSLVGKLKDRWKNIMVVTYIDQH